jgi:hypothetical protein
MADLLSPGISVTVSDQSIYIPATATTIPLFFVATKESKILSDGSRAAGTFESHKVRTVTSLRQSQQLFGVPNFYTDEQGNQQHGDCRNEYGIFALNQFLAQASLAYVVRANIDLDDNIISVLSSWTTQIDLARTSLINLANTFITDYNNLNGYTPVDPQFKQTVNQIEFLGLVNQAMDVVYAKYAFRTVGVDFEADLSANPLPYYENGYNFPPTGQFIGINGIADFWVSALSGTVVPTEWTPDEAGDTLLLAAQMYQYTNEFVSRTSLGPNDAQRRVAVVTALQQAARIEDVKSEIYEYNIIVCPGFPEIVDELMVLNQAIGQEAFIIADTPSYYNPDDVVSVWSASSDRMRTDDVAYYYPPMAFASNLDGVDVACAISGVALSAYTFNDKVAYVWFAPGGVNRALIHQTTGVTAVGYIEGNLGTATTFVDVHLNKGQRDNLYMSPNYINPVINSPGTGLALWGQRVSMPGNLASARDRVNVARLICYMRRNIRKFLIPFLFEPNDKITRDNAKSVVDSFLHDILVKRGLDDFVTICNESNNTGDKIDRNELWVDIGIKPTRAVEFIYVPIKVYHSGDTLPS